MKTTPLRLFFLLTGLLVLGLSATTRSLQAADDDRPNILFAISDDQSWAHTSAAGYPAISTPNFDRVAKLGVRFTNCFCGSPGCSPSRASLLTGRYPWMIEHAGTHASEFPARYEVYPDMLERAGYFVGYTGKGWGPGNWRISGRERNPAGPDYSQIKSKEDLPAGINKNDYAANFAAFLKDRPTGKPFCFWYGATEPHRSFEKGIGLKRGKKLEDADVPAFLPDTPEVRSDLLDYCVEIEHFDAHLGRMLDMLEKAGELENTLVVVTSDNGMAFPRAKANCYEYGVHMPLAVCWPKQVPGGRVVDDLVSFTDLAPTYLDVAGLKPSEQMVGKSLMNVLESKESGRVDPSRDAVYSARERHSSSRWNNLAYPQRALRTTQYLYIRNFRPERWPAGTPRKLDNQGKLGPMHGGYHDIDACPTLSFLIDNVDDAKIGSFLHLAVDHRPAEEMFDIEKDPACLNNLAEDPKFAEAKAELAATLESYLRKTGDPRILDGGDIFESYKRYSALRSFPKPDWAKDE
ncbi:MAG: sulfatase [Pirellulaceae bacterium]